MERMSTPTGYEGVTARIAAILADDPDDAMGYAAEIVQAEIAPLVGVLEIARQYVITAGVDFGNDVTANLSKIDAAIDRVRQP
jgi:hypothetical protein